MLRFHHSSVYVVQRAGLKLALLLIIAAVEQAFGWDNVMVQLSSLFAGLCFVLAIYSRERPTASKPDIGLEGEKEVSAETIGRVAKRDGSFNAFQHKLEFEFTPTQFMQFEFAALGAPLSIRNVPDLANRDAIAFSGFSGEFRYLLIGRGPSSPFGLTFSVEPTFARLDDTSGEGLRRRELE